MTLGCAVNIINFFWNVCQFSHSCKQKLPKRVYSLNANLWLGQLFKIRDIIQWLVIHRHSLFYWVCFGHSFLQNQSWCRSGKKSLKLWKMNMNVWNTNNLNVSSTITQSLKHLLHVKARINKTGDCIICTWVGGPSRVL